VWFPDADEDGYGAAAGSELACEQPEGHVATSGDCNDANAAVHPEGIEVCNGQDDDCDFSIDDGILAPAATPGVRGSKVAATASFGWDPVEAATGYDAIKGGLGELLSISGDFSVATGECIGNDVSASLIDDDELPPAGDALWYLVRAVNCGGVGSYDSGGLGQAAPRDGSIDLSPAACP
jgi:hypothetical protein